MTDHDPLCTAPQYWHSPGTAMATCQCWLIAKVRADEREQVMARVKQDMTVDREKWTVLAGSVSAHQAMADLRAKVDALPQATVSGVLYVIDDVVSRTDVLALFDGSSE